MKRLTTISEMLVERQITRLCHFAPLLNVHHILASESVLSSERVAAEVPSGYHPTDAFRIDNRRSHICTSIEYPNVWYLEKLELAADNYPDHAVFLIEPDEATREHVLFSPRNAAGGNRMHLSGNSGFAAMYRAEVHGKQLWRRGAGHPTWLPTDMQAEVLIPDAIPLSKVLGIVVKSREVAAAFLTQLHAAKTEFQVPLLVSPGMFDKYALGRLRTGGPRPEEERFEP